MLGSHDITISSPSAPAHFLCQRHTKFFRLPILSQLSKKVEVALLQTGHFSSKGGFPGTVEEEIFVGEKFRTFLSKTFRMEFNFVSRNDEESKNKKRRSKDCKPGERRVRMEINFVLFSIIRKPRN